MIQQPALGVSPPVFVESMIRSTLTVAALTIASMTGSVHADTVRGALCGLKRLAPGSSVEEFSCDFTQLQGNAYITGSRWKFAFPAAEQNKTYSTPEQRRLCEVHPQRSVQPDRVPIRRETA